MRTRILCVVMPGLLAALPHSVLGESEPRGVEHTRVAFVTSVTGTSIFGDWPQAADALEGLEAADSICENRASAGGLASPGDFIAWVSDSTDDAYCRLHGLGGKKSANCGEEKLPESGGPWVRTDGAPWAPGVPDFPVTNGVIYTPLSFDEFGNPVSNLSVRVWTVTTPGGELNPSKLIGTCSDWTDTPDETTQIGATDRTTFNWTNFGTANCSLIETERRLFCLEKGSGPALELPEPAGRLAFIASEANNGQLGGWDNADKGAQGLQAGDSICNNLAQAGGLPDVGTYKAWLSDQNTDAKDRFENDGPWYRLDGILVAENLADLVDDTLFSAINQTETGNYLSNRGVRTGTMSDGTKNTHHCNSWTSNSDSDFGSGGRANATSGSWTEMDFMVACDSTISHIFCLSDASLDDVFDDGFEN